MLPQSYSNIFFTFLSGIHIREITYNTTQCCHPTSESNERKLLHQLHSALNEGLSHIGENLKKLPLFDDPNEDTNPQRHTKIHFILPLSGRFSTFLRFMKIYEEICIKNQQKTTLTIVLYRSQKEPDDFAKTVDLVDSYKSKYRKSDISVVEMSGAFSRASALQEGTKLCSLDDLMFFIDVDIVFNTDALLRIRFNTIKGRQLYFPIVYSQYDPELVYSLEFNRFQVKRVEDDFFIDERNGFWRQFGFGIVGIYRSDFVRLGGFDTNITGWGFEDVHLYEEVIKKKVRFMRTPDPGLVHVYHPVECDSNLKDTQKEMCLGTKASMLGSTYNLEQYIRKHSDILKRAEKAQEGPG